MEWTDDHDVVFLREMANSDILVTKKGSPDRGKIWQDMMTRLNQNVVPN